MNNTLQNFQFGVLDVICATIARNIEDLMTLTPGMDSSGVSLGDVDVPFAWMKNNSG